MGVTEHAPSAWQQCDPFVPGHEELPRDDDV